MIKTNKKKIYKGVKLALYLIILGWIAIFATNRWVENSAISQQFHNERALFIADRKGVEAVAFNAEDVSMRYGFKTRLRERLARVKMLLDLVFGKQPKFLGEKVLIQ